MPRCCFLLILLTSPAFAQRPASDYQRLVDEADSLYNAGAFKEAAFTYTEAFKVNEWKGFIPDIYNAARSWARIGNPDSAFRKLDRIITYCPHEDFENYEDFPDDPSFLPLHSDDRWQSLIAQAEKKYNNPLINELKTIFETDQEYRLAIDSVIARFGADSDQAKALWTKMRKADSLNVLKVTNILDKHGWLGADVVGQRGSITIFLVIQHADLATQLKYLPMMRKAVDEGDAAPSHLAMLEDRLALRQGRHQIYGSQVALDNRTGRYYVEDLLDPENVDKRRAAMGLPPLAEYVKQWGITWDAEEYKRQMKNKRSK